MTKYEPSGCFSNFAPPADVAWGVEHAPRLCLLEQFCPLVAFPLGQRLRHLSLDLADRVLGGGDRLIELRQLQVVLGPWGANERRRGRWFGHAVFGDVVEQREELIELALRERIVFVVVAAGAAQRHRHPHGRSRFDPVDHSFDPPFLGDAAPFARHPMVAVEAGGHSLREGGIGKQVARELLDGELIERLVAVVGVDDPVAPPPHVPLFVGLKAVAVGIAGAVEPPHGHPLAIVR